MIDLDRELKIGDTFHASQIADGEFCLVCVMNDNQGVTWGIGTDNQGIPYVFCQNDIDDESIEVQLHLPQPAGQVTKKKGKK